MVGSLIISYGLFIDREGLLDTWVLTRSTTNDMWYDKLDKSDNLLQNLNLAKDGLSDVSCLIMGKYSKSPDLKFSLAVDACSEKHSAVCKYNPQMTASLPEPPKFPCLTTNRKNRRKRSTSAGDHCKKGERQSVLVNQAELLPISFSVCNRHSKFR